ncbi:acylneuraminate cytidylyltransferase [Nocardioides sp. S5]|uniref:acylneuraminate cytidylyltransferase family protein n=1 Tax=Nocardioides sp. S5 TaxID=2017486 RepID=UPI001AF1A90F|nr:acylneuraminate cytidylyltransferase family protein [Nocardioides sp. S5]QSR32873.1 acylneuraminate cytidylyltransferase [Nocardioides sp. S5]
MKPLTLGVVPARGGSKGLPGKNTLSLAGVPLVVHAVRALEMATRVDRVVVSTDDPHIAAVAKQWGGDVPFRRPADLAADDTPMGPVLRHALDQVERAEAREYDLLVLCDPTSPGRQPEEIDRAVELLWAAPEFVGAIAVSEPMFQPAWVGVREVEGALVRYDEAGRGVTRRQDSEGRFLRINGSFYVWRTEFIRKLEGSWFDSGRHLGVEISELHAFSVDDQLEFDMIQCLVDGGLLSLPWLHDGGKA